jgi:hypothetical protein
MAVDKRVTVFFASARACQEMEQDSDNKSTV